MTVYASQLLPYEQTANTITGGYGGQDSLTIIDTGASDAVSANISSYTVPVDELANGQPVLNTDGLPNGTETLTAQQYFGGEPVIDPLTGKQMYYAVGAPEVDPFTCQPLRDPNGNVITYTQAEPMVHTACDTVVESRGANVEAYGGEQVYDENGNPVYTGTTPFTDEPGQAEIYNRGQQVYDLEQGDGTLVPIERSDLQCPLVHRLEVRRRHPDAERRRDDPVRRHRLGASLRRESTSTCSRRRIPPGPRTTP